MNDGQESKRLALQERLDSAKTQAERNRLGQFATPSTLASEIVEYAKSLLPRTSGIRFLDPAFGTGAFYSALLRSFAPTQIVSALGYEIDPHYGVEARKLWSDTALELRIASFTRSPVPFSETAKPNLIICNPPYVRHHHLPTQEKPRLQERTRHLAGIALNGLAGLYCYFLGIAHGWLAKDGLAGWLIPSEFMDVNYGQPLKQYLLERVTLTCIHRFDPREVQFGDALVSSAVVWFRNSLPPPKHVVTFTLGGTLSAPTLSKTIPVELLKRSPKWTQFPLSKTSGKSGGEEARLGDYFHIKRGLATGANRFFVLTPEQVLRHQLPPEFLIPILPSPRYLRDDQIQADSKGQPRLTRQHFLLACNRPEERVKAAYPSLWTYLELGVKVGISQRYLCQHRSPWYAQELRPPAPFLCTYMGRRENANRKPFRFILNHSQATAPNVYLMLYPKPLLKKLLQAKPGLAETVWQALSEIPLEALLGEGRVYGGGLHKLEPRELANAPASKLLAAVPELREKRSRQPSLFET